MPTASPFRSRPLRRLAGAIAISLTVLATGAPPATAAPAPGLRKAVDAVVAAGAPGAIVLRRDGTRVQRVAAGSADLRRRVPMRARTRLRVGSTTKSFVAAVVLQLSAEGRLALTDTVERWLPGSVPGGDAITLRQLLNHTSGLAEYSSLPAIASEAGLTRSWRPSELVALATEQPPAAAPGAGFAYANTNYVLLGLVVEAATGHRLADELKTRLFAPLRLLHTTFDPAPAASATVRGYIVQGRKRPIDVTPTNTTWAWAAGSIVSTVDDLAAFYRALLTGRVLNAAQLAEMQAFGPTGPGAHITYGLGLLRLKTPCGPALGHDGAVPGYRTLALSSPDGRRQLVTFINDYSDRPRENAAVAALEDQFCGGR